MINQLVGSAITVKALSEQDKQAMFALFQENYTRTNLKNFLSDLHNKDWVVLLHDPISHDIKGFSTVAFYRSVFEGASVGVVYSGDTIIDKTYWRTPELLKIWIKTVMEVGKDYPEPLYWFLISSGYKTYRFLTVFFKEFYPRCDSDTPDNIKGLMDHLALERFGDEYNPQAGIIRFKQGATPLKEGIADIDEIRIKSEEVRFFLQKNPGHQNGDELVCLTIIHPDNFTPAGKRMTR